MEIIIFLLLKLGILFGNPTQNSQAPTKLEQRQEIQLQESSTSTTNSLRDGGSATWDDNG